jgi:hypothetical protein
MDNAALHNKFPARTNYLKWNVRFFFQSIKFRFIVSHSFLPVHKGTVNSTQLRGNFSCAAYNFFCQKTAAPMAGSSSYLIGVFFASKMESKAT